MYINTFRNVEKKEIISSYTHPCCGYKMSIITKQNAIDSKGNLIELLKDENENGPIFYETDCSGSQCEHVESIITGLSNNLIIFEDVICRYMQKVLQVVGKPLSSNKDDYFVYYVKSTTGCLPVDDETMKVEHRKHGYYRMS
ncbi:hypothetical protein A3Q56_00538 [Intoshia linei]|uniref:Uncharacterized protein n=1 Tax=Intoshia linei TaxID=1819745 RepID=A0A177BDL6_9BILA|nr:hypothetical protein A3Q56_00538 [Intoshia linei]